MLGQIMEQAGIPILIGMVCLYFAYRVLLYFAYRVLILKDIKAIRGKDKPEPEDKEGYCRDIGRLLVFFGLGSFLMGILEMVHPMAALVQTVLWVVITFILWKRVDSKYF